MSSSDSYYEDSSTARRGYVGANLLSTIIRYLVSACLFPTHPAFLIPLIKQTLIASSLIKLTLIAGCLIKRGNRRHLHYLPAPPNSIRGRSLMT